MDVNIRFISTKTQHAWISITTMNHIHAGYGVTNLVKVCFNPQAFTQASKSLRTV